MQIQTPAVQSPSQIHTDGKEVPLHPTPGSGARLRERKPPMGSPERDLYEERKWAYRNGGNER